MMAGEKSSTVNSGGKTDMKPRGTFFRLGQAHWVLGRRQMDAPFHPPLVWDTQSRYLLLASRVRHAVSDNTFDEMWKA